MAAELVDLAVALDDVEPLAVEVGYGELGRGGRLGYEDGFVRVAGVRSRSALSTHPPARVRYALPASARRFRARVALNDDVASRGSHATFTVVADGRVVAVAPDVRAGAPPVAIEADVREAEVLELVVTTTAWAFCHAVWLEPAVDGVEAEPAVALPATILDPLRRAEIEVPRGLAPVDRCIATVASAGFERWLDDLLASVRANGGCDDAPLAVLSLDGAASVEEIAQRHAATVIRCHPLRPLDPTSKSVLYALAELVPAERFLALDADMLVLDDLDPLFAALDACAPESILVCGEGNDHGIPDLATALDAAYGGGADPPFFRRDSDAGRHPLVVNDGLLAGRRSAFASLAAAVRGLPGAVEWVDARADIRWRNQFALNVALVEGGLAVELDPTWNIQLHVQDVEPTGARARWRGRDVRVLHFAGAGKLRHGPLRDAVRAAADLSELLRHGRVEDALAGACALGSPDLLPATLAAELNAVAPAMAPPTSGSAEAGDRPWATSLPRAVLLDIQQAVHHQRYRGRQLVKSPFDLAMYQQLLERDRPATIVEIGSKDGGSALWLAGLTAGLGLDCTVRSFDVHPVRDVEHPGVVFAHGDGRRLGDTISSADLTSWPRPWLVIDDADHREETTAAILAFFDPHLHPGDVVVVEDGNLADLYPDLHPGGSGPHRALRRFLAARGDRYEIAADLCDLFGYNATTASNGILRRCSHRRPSRPRTAIDLLGGRPWLDADVPADALAVPTMLSLRERQVLWWLARHHVTGVGRIFDGGSFLGGSTAALASGLAARSDRTWQRAIASYDLFRVEPYTIEQFGHAVPDQTVGATFRPAFEANVAPWADLVEVREGDACAIGWSGEAIEVLFLDLVKTWELNDLVLGQLLPCLIPGHSVIVQQDYLWGYGPWIHLTMELLDGAVRQLDAMANGSVVYLLVDEVPRDLFGLKLRTDVAPSRALALMDRAVERWAGEERGLVELARVLLVAELAGSAAAREEFAAVLARHGHHERVRSCAPTIATYLPG